MQGSILTIMVAYLQRMLTQETAIPFGAIFATLQVSQLSILWSKDFWATVTTKRLPKLVHIGFICLIPFNVLLASTVGPSSAIAMQPRLADFKLQQSRLALNLSDQNLFPATLSLPGLRLDSQVSTSEFPRIGVRSLLI